MYTRCPACETTFRLGAEDLRRAQGKVRCGDCDHVFNALEYLAEEPEDQSGEVPVLRSEKKAAQPLTETVTETADAGIPDEGVELEITAYDEKTGETWSPLETGSWGAEELTPEPSAEPDDSSPFVGLAAVPYAPVNDPLPEDTLEEEADDEAEIETGEIVEAAEQDDLPEFDDTVWERIPGVGASEEERENWQALGADDTLADGLSYTGRDFTALDEPDEDETDEVAADEVAADEVAADEVAVDDEPDETVEQPQVIDTSVGETVDQPSVAQDETVEQPAPISASTMVGDTPVSPVDTSPVDTSDEWYAEESPDEAAMTFDVPADKWSSFFGDAPRPAASLVPAELTADTDDLDAEQGDELNKDPAETPDEETHDEAAEEHADSTSGDNDSEYSDAAEHDSPDNDIVEGSDDGVDPTESWPDFDSHEEVVMATGEFGASEIASSFDRAEGETSQRTYASKDWAPGKFSQNADPENADAQNEQQAPPAWQTEEEDKPGRKGLLTLGIAVLAVALGLQLVHYNRDALAAHPSLGDTVRSLYSRMGSELYPTWATQSYEIRGSEAVAGESGPDVLDIRTQIAAVSDTAVGLPHLRVVLRDRWSNPVAARNFAPGEYALEDSLPNDGLLRPNETIAAHVAIVDPGSGAQGYELELCLPRRHTGLDCTGQTP